MGGNRRSIETLGTSSTFLHDLALSGRAIAAAPLMVVLTIAIAAAGATFGRVAAAGLLVQLILAGFVGVQRIWFLRVWRESVLELHEIAPLIWRFLGRYIALGAIVAVTFIPIVVLDVNLGGHHYATVVAIGIVYALLVDVLLTFVTPALAYTTRSVRDALEIGIRMLATTWPRSAWYALTPGLVLVSFGYFLPSRSASLLAGAIGAVLALWFKGAVAAFYLRIHPELDGFGA